MSEGPSPEISHDDAIKNFATGEHDDKMWPKPEVTTAQVAAPEGLPSDASDIAPDIAAMVHGAPEDSTTPAPAEAAAAPEVTTEAAPATSPAAAEKTGVAAAVAAESANRQATSEAELAKRTAQSEAAGNVMIDSVPTSSEAPAPAATSAEAKPSDWDEALGMRMSDPRWPTANYAKSGPLPKPTGSDGYNTTRSGAPARDERPTQAAMDTQREAYRAANGLPPEGQPAPVKKRSFMDRLLGRNR